jgi:hypothetical protein
MAELFERNIRLVARTVVETKGKGRWAKSREYMEWSKIGQNDFKRVELAILDVITGDIDFGTYDEGKVIKLLIAILSLPKDDWEKIINISPALSGDMFQIYALAQTRFGLPKNDRCYRIPTADRKPDFPFSPEELAEKILTTSENSFESTISSLIDMSHKRSNMWKRYYWQLEMIKEIYPLIPREWLYEIAQRTVVNGPINKSFPLFPLNDGWPDITTISGGKLKLLEVKSPNDSLQKSQKRFFNNMRDLHFIEFEIIHAVPVNDHIEIVNGSL